MEVLETWRKCREVDQVAATGLQLLLDHDGGAYLPAEVSERINVFLDRYPEAVRSLWEDYSPEGAPFAELSSYQTLRGVVQAS